MIFTECNTTLLALPRKNAGNQTYPSPFEPGMAVNYKCAPGYAVIDNQTFSCSGSDGSFTPSTPPNCIQGNLLHEY